MPHLKSLFQKFPPLGAGGKFTMKKIVLFVSLITSLTTFAQNKTQYGFRVGLNNNYSSIIDNQTDIISRFRPDLHIGGFYRFNLAKRISLQPELVYNNRGGSLKGFSVNFPETESAILRNNFQYVSVPVILGISPAKNIFFEVGPEYSVALNAGKKYGPDVNNDLGLVLGARIDMLDAASLFSLSFRYVYGLRDVSNDTFTSTSLNKVNAPIDMRNRTFQVSISYNFSEYYRWWSKYGIKKKKK